MPFAIDWKGPEVRDKVAAAAIAGVDFTMEDAVRKSKANHVAYPPASLPGERYANRTGSETASLTVKDPAGIVGARVRGTWGADNDTSLYVEIGTSRKGSGAPRAEIRAAEGGGDMWAIPPPSNPPQMAARYTLRPAASQANRLLAARIGMAFRGEELV